MKKTMTIILLLFSTVGFSQEQERDSIQITDTERIIDKYGDKIISGFNTIIEETTPYAEKGFELAVRLKIATGIFHIVLSIIAISIIVLILKQWNNWIRNNDMEDPAFVVFLAAAIYTVIGIYHSIVLLIIPEWFAIKEIIKTIN